MPINNRLTGALRQIESIYANNAAKRYWMVRTDNGSNYNTFAEGRFIALNIQNWPSAFLSQIITDYPDAANRVLHIREALQQLHRNNIINLTSRNGVEMEGASLSRLVNQIYAICYEMKQGDIVIIPDQSAFRLRIGRITDEQFSFDPEINNHFSYTRHVEWIKEINKSRLDPCLYKALGAHQAVCDISKYAEFIERNYNSYFAVEDKFHYVLTVNAENISAYKLTQMINSLLVRVREASDEFVLDIDIEDISFSINVNSPGKFSFVTTAKNAAILMAIAVALFGGRLHYEGFEASTDGAFRTVVECIMDWENNREDNREKAAMFDQMIQSLDVKSVEDINNMVDAAEKVMEQDDAEAEPRIQ